MAAYHIQQAAEKYLKAALVASGVAPPRTHDLVQLLSLIPGTPASQIVQKAATMITSFAWLTRYPGASKIDATHISDGNVNLEEIKRWVDSSIASRGP
jgi:HEPN domain-containing protein